LFKESVFEELALFAWYLSNLSKIWTILCLIHPRNLTKLNRRNILSSTFITLKNL